jgi:hypothetical protein
VDQRRQPPTRVEQQSGSTFLRRLVAFVALALVFTIAVIVAVVIATSTSSTVVHFRTVVGNDAQSVINSIRDLINQYTK